MQPLVVRVTDAGFELIAGERRLRAAREAGLDRVPVLIRQAAEGESMELALVENLQREDLNPLETAGAYQALMESFGLSREQLANRLGKSRAAVTNTLRLMQLPGSIRELLLEGSLSEGHARALIPLEEEKRMITVANKIVSDRLSVRATEELVRKTLSEDTQTVEKEPQNTPPPEQFSNASQMIQDFLGLPTRVRTLRRGGKIEIRFRENEELEAILALLTSQKD